ncbi:MAG: sigma-70 family RNA polymerase sigma factor [Phycisphaerae bacterium]|nr:sigma-70 family RNA polymerase sigma factor [Phycisphaerae bacterium]
MSSKLDSLDEQVHYLLEQGKSRPSSRSRHRDTIFKLLLGPVKGLSWHDLATWRAKVPADVRHDAVENWWVEHFRHAFDQLDNVNWEVGEGFDVVNPNRVQTPSNLRRCLTAAVIRDARKECSRWMREHGRRPVEERTLAGDVTDTTPDDNIQVREESEQVQEAIGRLPAELREPFIFRWCTDWTLREIAQVIGTNHVSIHRRLVKAKSLLRQFLDEMNNGIREGQRRNHK